MSKRIIFCFDGTWETPQDDTNVYKLFQALPTTADQIAFYDDGVGADGSLLRRLSGIAFGGGVFSKIKEAYTKIAHVYEPGDEIFLFGFSRGAYTARSLAGMIAACGLPTASGFDDNLIETAFAAYRDKAARPALLQSLSQYAMDDAKIKMIGVWDTVGALGIPAIFGGIDHLYYGFLDTALHPDVQNAYHAVSIDEQRQEFPPTLWTPLAPPTAGQTVEQVWFSGVHSNVGGGYPERGLSDITLAWMLGKAATLGLKIDSAIAARYTGLSAQYALDTMHKSWTPAWGFPMARHIAPDATLANSVALRCAFDPAYRPKNLILVNGVPAPSYSIVQTVNPPPSLPPPPPPAPGP